MYFSFSEFSTNLKAIRIMALLKDWRSLDFCYCCPDTHHTQTLEIWLCVFLVNFTNIQIYITSWQYDLMLPHPLYYIHIHSLTLCINVFPLNSHIYSLFAQCFAYFRIWERISFFYYFYALFWQSLDLFRPKNDI